MEATETKSLWSCRTKTGWCVVRVDGVQESMGGPRSVVVVPSVRGSSDLSFAGSPSRVLEESGFRLRYRKVSAEVARRMSSETRPEHETSSDDMQRPPAADPRQSEMFDIVPPVAPTQEADVAPWAWDAVVLNAGCGSASLALSGMGFSVVGVCRSDDEALANVRNGFAAIVADPSSWSPYGPARVVVCLRPRQASAPPEDADSRRDHADPRVEASVAVASRCGAEVLVIEVEGGRRGSERDLPRLRELVESSGLRAHHAVIDAQFLGVPQRRPTRFLVGIRVPESRSRAPFRWPNPTHGPRGCEGIEPFTSVRTALGLDGEWEQPAGEPNARTPVNVDLPAPTIGPGGLSSPIRRKSARGADPGEERRLSAEDLAALQGLPRGFCLSPVRDDGREPSAKERRAAESARMKSAATSIPPRLISAVVSAAFATIEASASWEKEVEGGKDR